MIPIRDTIPSKNYPIVNNTLIALNVLFYLVELAQGPELQRFIYIWGMVPARFTDPYFSSYYPLSHQLVSLFTFMFLHSGFWHILGNMWFLYIFGDNVEDTLGPLRYLVFYILCGLASGIFYLALNAHSNIPIIGASGAIAGVMGAYFILYPRAKVLTLIPIIIIPWFVNIPAFLFLGFWFVIQALSATGSQSGAGGIAWWAHVGGFISGIIFLKIFKAHPKVGRVHAISRITAKKKSHRLQMIRPQSRGREPHLYGTIVITPFEAMTGTVKTVNIPWGFYNRMFKVAVPMGTRDGAVLRLKNLGRQTSGGSTGDLYLKVILKK